MTPKQHAILFASLFGLGFIMAWLIFWLTEDPNHLIYGFLSGLVWSITPYAFWFLNKISNVLVGCWVPVWDAIIPGFKKIRKNSKKL